MSTSVLRLYRQLLKGIKVFPSKSRDSLYKEAQLEFRKNMKETDPEKLNAQIEAAVRGVAEVNKWKQLNPQKSSWKYDL